jgi:hypothetical protein
MIYFPDNNIMQKTKLPYYLYIISILLFSITIAYSQNNGYMVNNDLAALGLKGNVKS